MFDSVVSSSKPHMVCQRNQIFLLSKIRSISSLIGSCRCVDVFMTNSQILTQGLFYNIVFDHGMWTIIAYTFTRLNGANGILMKSMCFLSIRRHATRILWNS